MYPHTENNENVAALLCYNRKNEISEMYIHVYTNMILETWKDFIESPDYSPCLVRNWWESMVTDQDMCNVHERDSRGGTLLHYAVLACLPDEVEKLVENGADVNASTNDGGYKPHHMIPTMILMLPHYKYKKEDVAGILGCLMDNGAVDTPADGLTLHEMIHAVPFVRAKAQQLDIAELI
jgi:hypothetical protein